MTEPTNLCDGRARRARVGHHDGRPAVSNLREILGDRYDAVTQEACGCGGTRTPHCFECSDSTGDHECPDPVPCVHRNAKRVLGVVLPDLLAEAWDEGHHAGHEDARAVQATYPEPTPNPYCTEETDHA